IREGAPLGPLRSGASSPLGLKSCSCLTRYSYGWAARFGLTGMMLLPASPWQLAQAMTPRDVSPFTYSCSPAAASGLALASAAWLTEIAQVPINTPLATSILESIRFMKTSMIANSTRHQRRHDLPFNMARAPFTLGRNLTHEFSNLRLYNREPLKTLECCVCGCKPAPNSMQRL